MAKLFPTKQHFVDLRDGEQVTVTKVTIVNATSDYVVIPTAKDVQLLQDAKATADPTFYLSGRDTVVNIDGATVGTEYIVVANHGGMVNFNKGDQGDITE